MKIRLSVLALFITTILFSQQSIPKPDNPQITFEKTVHSFGIIESGSIEEYEFKFTNTGTGPVIITYCSTTCSCGAVDWSKEPVMPGATGVVIYTYTASAQVSFNKTILVYSNATPEDQPLRLYAKGEVQPAGRP